MKPAGKNIFDEHSIVAVHRVPTDLPILKDHFPTYPIFPAYLQLEWVRRSLAKQWIVEAFINIKFLMPILPGNNISLEIFNSKPSGCDFAILIGNHTATKGRVKFV